MIRVACPHCQRTFRTMTEGMGKTAVCSGCGQSFRIGSARPPFSWKPNSLAEDSWVGVEPPQEKKEIKHCIICDAPLAEGAIRCLACGANQITGLVHRSRNQPAKDVKAPLWSLVPIKSLIVLVLVGAIGTGVFFAVRGMFSAAVDDGLEMAQVRVIRAAAQQLAAGMEPEEFSQKYFGKVNDGNLPRFLQMLDAGDPMIRKAAPLLIACGKVTQVGPIVERAKSAQADASAGATAILQAIGPRRLVQLSCDKNEPVRGPAAQALCLLSKIDGQEQELAALSEAGATQDKIEKLNKLCRTWPRAAGLFSISMNDKVAPIQAQIEQIGRTFYLQIGSHCFVSDFDAERRFTIPIDRWCAATGVAVDPKEIRNWIDGSVTLSSPFGAAWEGEARVTARRNLKSAPPGFLPIDELEQNETVTLPVALAQQ